jgi:hypothetical protein
MALVTAAYVQAWKPLQTDDKAAKDRLTAMIAAASAWLEASIGRPLSIAQYTELLSGDGTSILRPRYYPILSVSSLKLWSAVLRVMAQTDADTGQEVMISQTGKWLSKRHGVWPTGRGNVSITYRAGIVDPTSDATISTTSPPNVQQSVCMVAWLLLDEVSMIGKTQRTIGNEQITLMARNMKDYQFIKDTIDAYAREF